MLSTQSEQKYNTVLLNYIKNSIRLAGSITFKNDIIARYVNKWESMYNPSVSISNDRNEWKYYKHLRGEYYITDTPMSVISLDTYNVIEFNKENLEAHIETRDAYQYGTSYFETLVNKYPNNVSLIMGILYPPIIDDIVEAEDGTIVSYNKNLIEDQEFNLIEEVEDFIKNWLNRFYVNGYMLTDDLYASTMLGILSTFLPSVITNSRLKYAKTEQANSFHVSMGLGNFFNIYDNSIVLTDYQKRWLYRNAQYLASKVGSREVKDLLHTNLVNTGNVSMLDMKQIQVDNREGYHPTLKFLTDDIGIDKAYKYKDIVDIYLERQMFDTSLNIKDNEITSTYEELKRNAISSQKTNLIISKVNGNNNVVDVDIKNLVIDQWVDSTKKGNLSNKIHIEYNGITYSIDHTDANVIYWYLIYKYYNTELTRIPNVYSTIAVKPVIPNIDDTVLPYRLSTETYNYLKDIIIPTIKPSVKFLSNTTFMNYVNELYNSIVLQKVFINSLSFSERKLVESYLESCYTYDTTDFSYKYVDYADFFNSNREFSWLQTLDKKEDIKSFVDNLTYTLFKFKFNDIINIDEQQSLNYVYSNLVSMNKIIHTFDTQELTIYVNNNNISMDQPTINSILGFYDSTLETTDHTANDDELMIGAYILNSRGVTSISDVYT